MLGQCSSLTMLNLSFNDIGTEGAGSLAGVLGQCSSLAMLKLGDNDIGYAGARSLAGVLGQCSSLVMLDLTFNDEMGDEGLAMIRMSIPETVELVV